MRTLFIISFCCTSLMAFCQKGDYLVKNNGDTVWGDISLKNKVFQVNGITPSFVNATEVSTIKSERYKGSTVIAGKLLTYTDNLSDLEIDFIKHGETDTVLVLNEIYSSPKMNLYYVTDKLKVPFYFYKTPGDAKPLQLVVRYFLQGGLDNYSNDREKYRGEKSKVSIAEDKGYVNQLYAIMGDCKNIPQAMWELLTYRDYSLKQLIKRYNKCN